MSKKNRAALHRAINKLAREIVSDAQKQAARRDLTVESVAEVIFDGTTDALWAAVSDEMTKL